LPNFFMGAESLAGGRGQDAQEAGKEREETTPCSIPLAILTASGPILMQRSIRPVARRLL